MNISPTITPAVQGTNPQRGRLFRFATTGVLAATAINLGLYAIGRAADASLIVDPGAGPANHHVGTADVLLKTLIPLSIGVGLLAWIARRRHQWTSAATAIGAVLAIPTGIFPFLGAHDTTTGVLLASMHTVGGVAFVLIARKIAASQAVVAETLNARQATP